MKEVFVFAAAVFGGTMVFFGNDFGFIGLIPAMAMAIKDSQTI